ncbi:MAG: hypothetical protein VKP63_01230 [Cyanobacteriota bacterium]|nr:hypothetical protein [Cyanobacteriota bacterium]
MSRSSDGAQPGTPGARPALSQVDGAPIGTRFNQCGLSNSSDLFMSLVVRGRPEGPQKQAKCLSMKNPDQSHWSFWVCFSHEIPGNLCELFFTGQEFTPAAHHEI